MSRSRHGLARGVIVLLAVELATAVALAAVGACRHGRFEALRDDHRDLVAALGLGDLALWSDASYCRHPSLADFFSAHADHPSAMEHFPAGSMVPPPIRRQGGGRDGGTTGP